MSKITDAIDAAGRDEAIVDDFGCLLAATDAAGAARGLAALREGASARTAAARALGGLEAEGSMELLWSFEAGAARGFVDGAASALREGSYRGHDVLVLDSNGGVDLLQALAMLDELPLADLREEARARHLEETCQKVRRDAEGPRSADERLDPAHIEALLDAEPPAERPEARAAVSARRSGAIDAGGDVVMCSAGGGSAPLLLLRGGRPFLALGLDGDPLKAQLRFLLAFIDLSMSLEEAAEQAKSEGAVAVMIDDEYGRHGLGVVEGITSGQS